MSDAPDDRKENLALEKMYEKHFLYFIIYFI